MKFGQFVLTKIIKVVAIRCQNLICTKFDFGWWREGLLPLPNYPTSALDLLGLDLAVLTHFFSFPTFACLKSISKAQ